MAKQENHPSSKDKSSATEQQLRATIQQLRATEQQLRAANQQLDASNQQLRATEQELRKVNHELQERVKEIECLYGLSQLAEQRDITLEEIFQGLVEIIPPGWQYPEITTARIMFEDRHYKTANFRKTTWLQSADIKVHDRKAGTIEVCYLREMPTIDEGPFLRQERKLLDALAERLGRIAERIRDEEALEAANQQLRADEQQLKAYNQQLQANEQQLRAANQQLQAEVNERKKAEEALQETHDYLDKLINYANAPIIVWDPKFRVTRFNNAFERLTGYTSDEVIGQDLNMLFPQASRKESLNKIERTLSDKYWESVDIPILCKNGRIRLALWNSANIYAEDGTTLLATIAQGQDITERKKAEEQLMAANQQLTASEQQLRAANQQSSASEQQLRAANQQLWASEQQLKAANQQLQAEVTERKSVEEKIKASLKEKEVLLKEIHHRVKNNMQVISSILNIQSKYVEDEKALEIFKNGQSRIRSMALVHEKLYESEDLANIDFAEYVHSITHYLFGLHEISPRIRLNLDIKDVLLDVNTAIPCGLIINELISNSLKYAFPEGIEDEICIQLSSDKDGELTLIVEDNGIGFPKDLDFRKTESLGMQLIIMLVEQLEGTVELDKTKGTRLTITFETPKPKDGEAKKWQV